MGKWTEFSFILKPSPIGGIGVFATHDIPAGKQAFSGQFSPRKMAIKDVHADFLKYCIFVNDEECLCPERFDRMEIGWFLNHSDKPNIAKNAEGLTIAVRDIKAGDEILCDYNQLNEPDHLKEAYYWQPKNHSSEDQTAG
jgi:SET domain-containing protein